MYLIYIDESGTIDLSDSENFVLGAMIINENKWFEIDGLVKKLKQKCTNNSFDDIEVHMCDIVNRKNEFSKMDVNQRIEIIKDIKIIFEKMEFVPVYVVIKKKNLQKQINIRYWAYNLMFERLCYQLNNLNDKQEKPQYGLLLFDNISKKRNKEIWDVFVELLDEGAWYNEKNKYLIDGPIFSDSKIRSPLQLADCMAYVINHRHKTNKNNNFLMKTELENIFDVITQKIITQKRYACKVFP